MEKNQVPTKEIHLTLPVPVLVGLKHMAHNRKCTVAHVIRQMIYHHLSGPEYKVYLGRLPGHRI